MSGDGAQRNFLPFYPSQTEAYRAMPLPPQQTDPVEARPEPEVAAGVPRTPPPPPTTLPRAGVFASGTPRTDEDAPVTFVPHEASGALATPPPTLIPAGRYGVLEAQELIHLLSSLDDERARGRFRESVYLSIFFWILVVLVILYGPHYLWHAPKLILPSDVLKQREFTQLNAPVLRHAVPAPKPSPKPALDNHTLEKLREMTRRTPAPVPTPSPTPPATAPVPTMAPPNAPTPVPTHAPPVVADAPLPQPRSKPTFNAGTTTSSNAVQQAIQDAARNQGSSGSISAPSRGGGDSPLNTGVDILSDTQGVNFDPYIRKVLREIYDHWLPLIPEEARPPLSKSGITLVRFTILPDGTIGAMHLDDSTHDDALNRAAWGSIVSTGQFAPLPSQFHGPNLELRIHYLVNKPQ